MERKQLASEKSKEANFLAQLFGSSKQLESWFIRQRKITIIVILLA
jgi:hypothetical protein